MTTENSLTLAIIIVLLSIAAQESMAVPTVVADSASRVALPNASVYDKNGKAIGVSNNKGYLPAIAAESFPLTLRYIGFLDKTIPYIAESDTIFLQENISELPELTVKSRRNKLLHILAYVREYSSLTSYTDTVFLFREKMVDFMLPADKKTKNDGWHLPRIMAVKSYARFSDAYGLDSVSDACRHHFSWADWMGLVPKSEMPTKLCGNETGTDTIHGKYTPAVIWSRNNDNVKLQVDVMADSSCRKWVPTMSHFFRRDTEFERFTINFNFRNITEQELSPLNLTNYSFHIESNGRARDMFMFNHVRQSFYVTTDAEVYITDKEYVTAKEARQ